MGTCGALAACADDTPGNVQVGADEVAAALARVEVQPGLWETRSAILSVSQDGLPREIAERMKGPRETMRHCITPAEAAQTNRNFLAARRGGRCTDETFAMSGGRIAGSTICRDAAGALTRLRTSGRYSADRYEMRTDVETPGIGRGRSMTLVIHQTGRRLRGCPQTGEESK